jgi:hypothetical protein
MKINQEAFLKITKFLYDNQIGTKQGYVLAVLASTPSSYTFVGLKKVIEGTTAALNSILKILKDKGFIDSVLNYNGTPTYRLTADTKNSLFGYPPIVITKISREDYEADRADKDNKISNEQ